jgi:hypothetical protein
MLIQKTAIVVTSIFSPNKSLHALAQGAKKNDWDFVVVGDVSSPAGFRLDGCRYFDLAAQRNLSYKLAKICPERHYTRKNIGYLIAIENGCSILVETDDDNIPRENFWKSRTKGASAQNISGSGWLNVYKHFTKHKVWPRGFPLELLNHPENFSVSRESADVDSCTIWQGLADENPDVDAVYRMTSELPIEFEKANSVKLSRGVWSPFNSQNTTWFKEAFPLLYLPSFCSFRMTDIWRSFVAQRIMWECNWAMAFHEATVWQERNEHNLLKDFEQEIPGYLFNNKIKVLLEKLELKKGVDNIGNNLIACYEELIRNNIISDTQEMTLLEAWLSDIKALS